MTWYVSIAFLYARLYGDRDTDLDGHYIYMKPPRVIEKLGLLPEAQEGALRFEDFTFGMGSRERETILWLSCNGKRMTGGMV